MKPDKSRIQPDMIDTAMRWFRLYSKRPGNSGKPPPGIRTRKLSDIDLNTGQKAKP